jgi:hypothetical protein
LRYAAAQLTSGFHIANMPSTERNQPAPGANDFLCGSRLFSFVSPPIG